MLQQLTPRVYQLDFSQEQDRPVLGYIRGDRFSLMVDAGNSPEHVQAYLAAVEESGFCQPDFVALTHSHWDHCFGLASLPMPSIACTKVFHYIIQILFKKEKSNNEILSSVNTSL